MSQDPYRPPGAPVRDDDRARRSSTPWAVFLGVLADIGGTIVAGMVLALLMPGLAAPVPSVDPSMPAAPPEAFQWFSLLVGLCFTVVGGYVAARAANHREYFHALLVGVVSLVLGELIVGISPESYPLAQRLVGDLLVIPAALVGGHLRLNHKAPARA
jgi:hypothetical protein